MKKILRKIALRILQNKRVSSFVRSNIFEIGRVNVSGILYPFREEILKDIFQYPSLINNGYLHIERSIDIIKSRSLYQSIVLDIGAASGETCILFAKAFPDAMIVGFEPIKKTFEKLSINTKPFRNIRIHQTALGKEKASSTINVMSRITSSSLLASQENSTIHGEKYFEILEREKIEVNRLDDFDYRNQSIALIKMDVQGYELEVLRGATETLKKTHFILLELQNHDIYVGAPKYYDLDQHVRTNGFELFDIIPSIREKGQIMEFDALYVNKLLALE